MSDSGERPQPAFDFFVSHSSREKELVEQLAEGLLEEQRLHCWMDIWAIPAASDWDAEIEKALRSCRGCIVVLGPSGWGPYHLREAQLALKRKEADPSFAVVPVLLPNADPGDFERLGDFFATFQWVSFDPNRDEREALQRIATALESAAPFPLGRPRMSPYTLRRDARRWHSSGRPNRRNKSIMYRGKVLQEALRIERLYTGQLDPTALEFLRACEDFRARRLRKWVATGVGLSVVFAALAVFALVQSVLVIERSRQARANGLANLAKVTRASDPTRALRIADAAYQLDPASPAAQQAMLSIFYDEKHYSSLQEDASVRAIALAPGGALIASGGYYPSVTIRSLNGKIAARAGDLYRHVTSLAFAPSGQSLVVGSYNRGARLYQSDGLFIAQLGPPEDTVFAVAFTPDGTSVLTGNLRGQLRRWGLDGSLEVDYPSSNSNIQTIAISPQGEWVVAGYFGGGMALWSSDGRLVFPDLGSVREPTLRAASFVANSEWILSAHDDGTVRLRGLDGQLLGTLQAHEETIWSLAVSPDGTLFCTASSDMTARVWRLATRTELLHELRGNTNWVTSAAFLDPGEIWTGGMDGTLRRWRIQDSEPRKLGPENQFYRFAVFDPGGQRLLANWGYGAALVDLEGRLIQTYEPPKKEGPTSSGRFSPDGQHVLTADYDGRARLWTLDGQLEREFEHEASVSAVCFVGSGEQIVSADTHGKGTLWGLHGERLAEFQEDGIPINGVDCSPDGTLVVTAAGNYFPRPEEKPWIRLRRTLGTIEKSWEGSYEQPTGVAFSPDGRQLLIGTDLALDPSVNQRGVPGLSALLLDLNGRLLQRFAGHRERVNAVAFSPEGRFLLTGSGLSNTELREGESARLWDTQSNLLFSYFADEPVVGVDFSGDGKHWVTAEGHSLRLWKTSQGIHEWLREAPIDSLPVAEIDSLLALGSSEPESEQGLWSSLAVSWRYLTQWLDGS